LKLPCYKTVTNFYKCFLHYVFIFDLLEKMKSRKRRRRSSLSVESVLGGSANSGMGGAYESGEPESEITVNPSSAMVLLDTGQVPVYRPGVPPPFGVAMGVTFPDVSGVALLARPPPIRSSDTIENVKSTGGNVARDAPTIESLGSFTSRINPMSGCKFTKYYGSYHSGCEWDTHRGNCILPIRVFIPPIDPIATPDHYIYDFFIKIPDGFVFNQENRFNTAQKFANMLNYLIQHKTWLADWESWRLSPKGWIPLEGNFGANWRLPFGQSIPLFRVDYTQSGKLNIVFNNGLLNTQYDLGLAFFVIFDHPNSIINRGGFLTGLGFMNPFYSPKRNAERSYSPNTPLAQMMADSNFEQPPLYTTYPLGENLVTWKKIPISTYIDPIAHNMTQANFNTIKAETLAQFKSSGPLVIPFTPFQLVYPGQRIPAMKDSRYFIHNSDEICFSQKVVPLTNKTLKSGSVLGPTTFGVDFRSYEEDNSLLFTSKPWRDSIYEGARFNPNIALASHTSLMHVQVQSYDEYGDPILSEVRGDSPDNRNLLPQETVPFVPQAGLDATFISYCNYVYPEILTGQPQDTQDRLPQANWPPFAYYQSVKEIPYPTTPQTIRENNSRTTDKNVDFSNYYDNKVRCSVSDTIAHFLQSIMF
jgi:hypothetical protein